MRRALARTGATLVFALAVLAPSLAAQEPTTPRGADRFAPLDWLIGEWRGYGMFASDTTLVHKRYAYDTAGMFLVERTLDAFPPSEPTTDYQLHQDFAVYYRVADGFAAEAFFVEGFVWHSAVRPTEDGFVVETEAVDNVPPGMRGRVTVRREGEHRFRSTFELAGPGEEFRVIERSVMERIR